MHPGDRIAVRYKRNGDPILKLVTRISYQDNGHRKIYYATGPLAGELVPDTARVVIARRP